MQPTQRYDVLVVGARCAGAAAAMLLARRGLRVLAIDRGAYGADTISTHALMRGGVLQLHRWGVLPRLRELGTPPVRSTTFHYGADSTEIAIRPADGVDALYAPRRMVLDSLLVDAAWEAGAEVRHGHTLAALIRTGNRVTGAVVLDSEHRPLHIEAGLVIGADGVGSAVARLAEAPVVHAAQHTTCVLYGHWSGLGQQGYHWHYKGGASVGVIQTNAGKHCVFVAVPPARYRTELTHDRAEGFHRVLRETAPRVADELSGARLESQLWTFAGRNGFLRQASGAGWALVGDAGYFKDPLTAHGMTDALRDAELLANAVAEGTDAALARYGALRDELSLPLFRITDEIASFAWDLDAVQALHRALNQAMKAEVAHLLALDGAALHAREKETTS
jgi:menaquinone-9 beta-reductase